MIVAWIMAALLGLCLGVFLVLLLGTLLGVIWINHRNRPTGRFTIIEGLRLHYHDTDAGRPDARPPVLVIHGASANLEEARLGLGDALAGRRTIYMDRPGHGHSERGGERMAAPSAQARIVAGLLDHLGIARALVVSHSWGGSVAAALAVLHPDRVAGLVFVAPATHPWPGGVAWYHGLVRRPLIGRLFCWMAPLPVGLSGLERAARAVFAPDPPPVDYSRRARIPLVLRPWNFRANSMDIHGLKANVTVLSPRYPEITAPTIVITGDTDSVVAPWIHAQGLVRDIADAELITIQGTGHMPHHAHAGVVAEAVETVGRRARTGDAARPVQMPV